AVELAPARMARVAHSNSSKIGSAGARPRGASLPVRILPSMRVAPMMMSVVAIGGCAHLTERPLSPLGRTHARDGFRGVLGGAAIVLPILDCDTRDLGVV